jgi:formylglycine-generating enzyme required for sulfatase activity
MKHLILALAASATALSATADVVPEVSGVTMTQPVTQRRVTISYRLEKAPAIITLDVQTNKTGAATDVAADWVSVGGEALNATTGDVWKKVAVGDHEIVWCPDVSWRGQQVAAARAVVTAWSADNPPDYLVVDLTEGAAANSERYYPAVEFLPGGLLANKDYRTTRLVMRRIPACDATWTMGSTALMEGDWGRVAKSEKTHLVTLTNDYYIGVFEITQQQYLLVQPDGYANKGGAAYFTNENEMRPAEYMTYNEIRNSEKSATADTAFDWPNDPNSGSFLGKLRTKTGLKFDLPSEAQWEFACRAGTTSGYWNDGSAIVGKDSDANVERLGRTKNNGGYVGSAEPAATVGATNGTATVGSYAPNAWGLYDMHGNVWELCLDWYEDDIVSFDGRVNIDPTDSTKTLSGATGANRVRRGGGWQNTADYARSASRMSRAPNSASNNVGFRLVLPVGE